MNTIQQISLKLQLGIDPAAEIHPDELRSMWNQVGEAREARGRAARARRGFSNGAVQKQAASH